ncbi:2-phospho-L-lactate transferase [Paraburkholderia rhynchosiae]|uniref:2-phospho-L-lactate transferase n=1 Tax=Paraburkholderia rhynchosiae TaxID=487049 RepID=A0A2N7W514_9BURK|nr:2-phospho-L-lactate transferase [Paraburkholderia rhynchosiae]PMS24487.1 2-phospho-L-lactate transferase [Paraburkholderia rhynchosiae]CAB3736153.1 Phosphoenolpyruvate transferase [Paraburkholderia rhynchosiae]
MKGISTIAFSGGVGGAKLALGLARVLPPEELLIVANTADDFDHLGLHICPDLDTITYTLCGRANRSQGWGIEGETWNCLQALSELGGPDWFRLGDRDVATHLYRTQRLREGARLSEVTAEICLALGIGQRLIPVSDDPVRTIVHTAGGDLPFQDYFVRQRCEPRVTGFRFDGADRAAINPELHAALSSPDLSAVIFCPSNPFVSIAPMLAIPGMQEALLAARAPIVAVSPIVGGTAVKGPAAKMMSELGLPITPLAVAKRYSDLATAFIVDVVDGDQVARVRELGLACEAMPTLMNNDDDKLRLASSVIDYCHALSR